MTHFRRHIPIYGSSPPPRSKYIFADKVCVRSYDHCQVNWFTLSLMQTTDQNDDCTKPVAYHNSELVQCIMYVYLFDGCGMGPLPVLVFYCFRENVVVTCKIGSFLCSLDNLLQKNIIFFFFGNQISKWRSFEKGAIFDLLFTFFSYQGKVTKIPSAHLTYILTCSLLTLLTFFALPIMKKIQIYQVRFLFSAIPGVDSYLRHFGAINK